MPRGYTSKYTDKHERMAEHIEEGDLEHGVPDEAESRAWATVNTQTGGGNKSESGRGVPDTNVSRKIRGKKGGAASASRTPEQRSASARKAAETPNRNREAKATAT